MAPRPRTEVTKHVGRRLRELREASGRTQDEVDERAGFTGKYVSEIERGLRDPPLTTLERLAVRGIGCPLDELVGGSGADAAATYNRGTGILPRTIRELSNELAALPAETRRRALRIVRAVIELARIR